VAVFFASWLAASLAGLHSSRASAGSIIQASLAMQPQLRETLKSAPATKARLAVSAEKSIRPVARVSAVVKPRRAPAMQSPADPFAKAVSEAGLTREKFLAAFARAGMTVSEAGDPAELALAMPIAERFHHAVGAASPSSAESAAQTAPDTDASVATALGAGGAEIQLAYAPVESGWDDPVDLALATFSDDPPGPDSTDDAAADGEAMPERAELPPAKPDTKPDIKPEAKPTRAPSTVAEKPAAPARKPAQSDKQQPAQALAYAKPDKPDVGAFKNLFSTPKAGKGVAIYDISAAVVHMPDGSKLEAHSGIGKMADNPRYVNVKMNGPTPPNTYRLTMREQRFHGVEAVRMTPIGDQTMHGRDGILAHSYLLRGGRAESHGCVAFKDYARFLKAFKQGKVTHIIVVPSMSKLPKARMASLGRGA
jgi:hypothetical protein